MILVLCSSHEDRCMAFVDRIRELSPRVVVVFHYTDSNPYREINHRQILSRLSEADMTILEIDWNTASPSYSLSKSIPKLRAAIDFFPAAQIVFDISVFTRRHLLMLCRWFDDGGYWSRLSAVYSEPKEYEAAEYIPLSFGVSRFEQIPGFAACANLGRPVHLMLFLGYEGDRALAVYEYVQPTITTLGIPFPPYRPEWAGKTEFFNRDLIRIVNQECLVNIESLDPGIVAESLRLTLGGVISRSPNSNILSPHGTKPQTFGVYMYVRGCVDPPSVIYASPLRHNHRFYSQGIGPMWVLK